MVSVFNPNTSEVYVCQEQPHPKDARFTAYQGRDGQWLAVTPAGLTIMTVECGSWQAFSVAESYLLADRSAFGGGVYRLGFVPCKEPLGPTA
jgi:hypothetical protein